MDFKSCCLHNFYCEICESGQISPFCEFLCKSLRICLLNIFYTLVWHIIMKGREITQSGPFTSNILTCPLLRQHYWKRYIYLSLGCIRVCVCIRFLHDNIFTCPPPGHYHFIEICISIPCSIFTILFFGFCVCVCIWYFRSMPSPVTKFLLYLYLFLYLCLYLIFTSNILTCPLPATLLKRTIYLYPLLSSPVPPGLLFILGFSQMMSKMWRTGGIELIRMFVPTSTEFTTIDAPLQIFSQEWNKGDQKWK